MSELSECFLVTTAAALRAKVLLSSASRRHALCVSAEPRRRYCTPLRVLLVIIITVCMWILIHVLYSVAFKMWWDLYCESTAQWASEKSWKLVMKLKLRNLGTYLSLFIALTFIAALPVVFLMKLSCSLVRYARVTSFSVIFCPYGAALSTMLKWLKMHQFVWILTRICFYYTYIMYIMYYITFMFLFMWVWYFRLLVF